MKRWVNDNNIARTDYKQRQENKQVKNGLRGGVGGIDLENYKKDIRTEALFLISYEITSWVFFRLMVKKCFGKRLFKYIEEIVNKSSA